MSGRTAVVVGKPSCGALVLARALPNARVVHKDRLQAVGGAYAQFLNWGCSSAAFPEGKRVFNPPAAVLMAVDKVRFFRNFGDLSRIPYATNIGDAERLFEEHRRVVCRAIARGCGGAGIVVAASADALVDAPLYTAYIPKRDEYRVHVVAGEVILVQQKRALRVSPPTGEGRLIRNHDNGWVFVVHNVEPPPAALLESCLALTSAMGLDYCGIDCMVGTKDGLPYILEVNTAVGLESPELIGRLIDAIRRLL